MTMEFEDRIRTWVDDQVAGVAPVTVDEVLDGPDSARLNERAGDGRRRWLVPAVAAAAVLVAGALAFVVLSGDEGGLETITVASDQEPGTATEPTSTAVGDPAGDGWETFVEPTFGWTWEQPVAWTSQSQRDYCGGDDRIGTTSTLVTNTDRRYSHPLMDPVDLAESGCSAAAYGWTFPTPLPKGFLGVEIAAPANVGPVPPPRLDSLFPLVFAELEEVKSWTMPGGTGRTIGVVFEGRDYTLSIYEGSDVGAWDRAALDRLVRSIEPARLPMTPPIVFRWLPKGAEVLQGSNDPYSAAQSVTVHVPEASGTSDPERSLWVRLQTMHAPLWFMRVDLESAEPQSPPNVDRDVPVDRSRITVRGVPGVLDRWVYGDVSFSRIAFLEHDNLAVEVTAHGFGEEEMLRIAEGLEVLAVSGP